MNNVFVVSDTHFGHDNLYTFKDYEGNHVRDFKSAQECDQLMIENWNKIVKPDDKVYHLGDIAFGKAKLIDVMGRLYGRKILIKGNHDREKLSVYAQFFKDIRGCHNLDNFLLTHVPIHSDSFSRFRLNVHGHTHTNRVKRILDGFIVEDKRYFNACVEVNGYSPIPFDIIREAA